MCANKPGGCEINETVVGQQDEKKMLAEAQDETHACLTLIVSSFFR